MSFGKVKLLSKRLLTFQRGKRFRSSDRGGPGFDMLLFRGGVQPWALIAFDTPAIPRRHVFGLPVDLLLRGRFRHFGGD